MSEKIPKGWKKVKLGEIVKIGSSKRIFYKEYVKKGIPFYRSKEIIEKHHRQEISTVLYISEKKYNEIKNKFGVPQKGDVLLTSVGTLGIPYVVKKDEKFYFKDGNLTWFKNFKEDLFNKFLYYWILSPIGKEKLANSAIGSTQPALTIRGLKNIDILLPPIEEQKAIAGVLSSLDDKIDLLHRQNKTLEQMAQTLFRKWFIEDAKEDWEYKTLESFVKVYKGVSYKSSELNNSNVALVTLKNFGRDGSLRFDGFKEYTGKYKEEQIVKSGDLVIAQTDITQNADIIGNPLLIFNLLGYEKLVISMDVIKIEPKNEWLSKEFLYYLMRTKSFKEHCIGFSNGSTVLHLSKDAIPNFEFFVPPKEKVVVFTSKVKKIIEKIQGNLTQIRTLEKLRDTLLPKLMSGEVRVTV